MDIHNLFSFEVLSNEKIKINYFGDSEIKVAISLILTGGNVLHTARHTFPCKNSWFSPEFNYMGCTHISLYDLNNNKHILKWLVPKNLSTSIDRQKIICLGLNKTGTTSFQKDLEQLGYNFLPTNIGTLKVLPDVYHNDFNSLYSVLDNPKFNAYRDLPFALPNIHEKIFEYRPNDIYVLTVRQNADVWVKSVIKHYGWIINHKNSYISDELFDYYDGPEIVRFSNFSKPLFDSWGVETFNDVENKLKNAYITHNNSVIKFFNERNVKNFIVLDVSKENELKRFTNWLRIKNDKKNFSWENKKS